MIDSERVWHTMHNFIDGILSQSKGLWCRDSYEYDPHKYQQSMMSILTSACRLIDNYIYHFHNEHNQSQRVLLSNEQVTLLLSPVHN